MQPSLSSIQSARQMLTKHLPATRLIKALHLSELSGKTVSLKLETELPTGSFKVRGALYTLALKLRQASIQEVVASALETMVLLLPMPQKCWEFTPRFFYLNTAIR